jgi:hypothetical protein
MRFFSINRARSKTYAPSGIGTAAAVRQLISLPAKLACLDRIRRRKVFVRSLKRRDEFFSATPFWIWRARMVASAGHRP